MVCTHRRCMEKGNSKASRPRLVTADIGCPYPCIPPSRRRPHRSLREIPPYPRYSPSESSLISGLINYIWDKQYELDCQTDPFPGDVINFRTSTTRALNNWRTLWDNMIPHLKMDRAQWARLGFFRNSLEYWYAAKLFLARPRRSGWGQPYDDDNNLFRVKRLLRIVRVWVVGGETKSGLSKRDLRVPNFLETLKVVVPELASVRIEEAPSAVPSPRPIWKSSVKKEEKN